jgi:hypothetical protein
MKHHSGIRHISVAGNENIDRRVNSSAIWFVLRLAVCAATGAILEKI